MFGKKKQKEARRRFKAVSAKMKLVVYLKKGNKTQEREIISYKEINNALVYEEIIIGDGWIRTSRNFILFSNIYGYKIIKKNSVLIKRVDKNCTMVGGLLEDKEVGFSEKNPLVDEAEDYGSLYSIKKGSQCTK